MTKRLVVECLIFLGGKQDAGSNQFMGNLKEWEAMAGNFKLVALAILSWPP
jgi:hypothetical protein